ncbi:phytanoyl-CoA dioxygenase family protein [Pandoraea captiosa]|uniref:phytanoyl-CoA dioxygenase family protein n=1 Tax=Pandoraea captiosa TaxID=2508302 RepID=UPI00158180EE|nr:phytanoyl-CoA dioxygenase family protein [Pandoraea captiosa]
MNVLELKDHESLPMFAVSPELAERIRKYNLEQNIEDMQTLGFTVVKDVAQDEFIAGLRSAIVRCCQEDKGQYFGITKKGISSDLLLARDPLIAEATLNPKILTMIEFMCGRGAQISQVSGSVRFAGANAMPLHCDQSWLPAPFPEHNALMTACWYCDDTTDEASGATKVVPGSHRERRHPNPEEVKAEAGARPLVAPRGSVGMWDGRLWHANYPRAREGERVLLHATYCRLAYRPLEDYGPVSEELIAKHGPVMADMLGRNHWWGNRNWNNGAVDMSKYMNTERDSRR